MFYPVTTNVEIATIVELAREIWTEHYVSIIGIEQVEYMLKNFHSGETIAQQIAEQNYHYFLIQHHEENVGYIGVQVKDSELFLSKIYLQSTVRGAGLGRASMEFIREFTEHHQLPKITLTVNKDNSHTIAAYYKMGFVKTDDICVDIGGGYVMDDIAMELKT